MLTDDGWIVKAFYWAADHPVVANVLIVGFIIGTLVQTVLRAIFPSQATRPRWVAALIAVADPFAGNLWRILAWTLNKVGLKIRNPFDDTATISASSVAAAEKEGR